MSQEIKHSIIGPAWHDDCADPSIETSFPRQSETDSAGGACGIDEQTDQTELAADPPGKI